MRAEPDQIEMIRVGFAIDQHEIGPDMAVAVILPPTRQLMILVTPGQLAVRRQLGNDAPKFGVQGACEPPFLFPPVVTFEG